MEEYITTYLDQTKQIADLVSKEQIEKMVTILQKAKNC